MHILRLEVDDSVLDKVMMFLKQLPGNKVHIKEDTPAKENIDFIEHLISHPLQTSEASFLSRTESNECSANLLKKFKFNEENLQKFIQSLYTRYAVTGLSQETFLRASNLRKKYLLAYYDSIIVSTALLSGCNVLYSEDMQDGLVVDGKLKIINPFNK